MGHIVLQSSFATSSVSSSWPRLRIGLIPFAVDFLRPYQVLQYASQGAFKLLWRRHAFAHAVPGCGR